VENATQSASAAGIAAEQAHQYAVEAKRSWQMTNDCLRKVMAMTEKAMDKDGHQGL